MSSRKRSSATPPAPVPTQPKPPWYKRTWVVVVTVGSAAFTLGMNGPTLLQNMRKLPAEVEVTRDQYLSWLKEDAGWIGDWSTFPEGNVDIGDMRLSDGVDLKISLQAKNGELGGMIASGKVCSNIPFFDFLLLRGNVSGNTANLEVWDIVGGQRRVFEQLRLVREGNVIAVHPAAGEASWFPQGVRIGRHPETNEAFMNGFCKKGSSESGSSGSDLKPVGKT